MATTDKTLDCTEQLKYTLKGKASTKADNDKACTTAGGTALSATYTMVNSKDKSGKIK